MKKWSAFLILIVVMAFMAPPVYARWVWGSGFNEQDVNIGAWSVIVKEKDTDPDLVLDTDEIQIYAKDDGGTTKLYTQDWEGNIVEVGSGSGTPAGNDTEVQFNDAGAFGADSDLTWNKTTNTMTINSSEDRWTFTDKGLMIDGNDNGSAGVLRIGSVNNTNNESLDFDFETTANTVGVSTATSVSKIDFGSIILEADFNSSDGTPGFTGDCVSVTTISVKDGLIVSCA